jgi:hypothetical protein
MSQSCCVDWLVASGSATLIVPQKDKAPHQLRPPPYRSPGATGGLAGAPPSKNLRNIFQTKRYFPMSKQEVRHYWAQSTLSFEAQGAG